MRFGFSRRDIIAVAGRQAMPAYRFGRHMAADAPKPTPMITLTNDEVGWIPDLARFRERGFDSVFENAGPLK
jgi:hypothetical protein